MDLTLTISADDNQAQAFPIDTEIGEQLLDENSQIIEVEDE